MPAGGAAGILRTDPQFFLASARRYSHPLVGKRLPRLMELLAMSSAASAKA